MALAGLIIMGLGSFGVGGAVIMEIRKKEPIYMVLMKIFPWLIGLGGLLFGLG